MVLCFDTISEQMGGIASFSFPFEMCGKKLWTETFLTDKTTKKRLDDNLKERNEDIFSANYGCIG